VSVGGQEKHAEAQALHREAVLASLFAASALSGLRQVVFVRIDVSLPGSTLVTDNQKHFRPDGGWFA